MSDQSGQASPEGPVRRQLAWHVNGCLELLGLGLGVAPRGHGLDQVAVLRRRLVPIAEEQAGDAGVVAVEEDTARLPRVAGHRPGGLQGERTCGAIRIAFPWRDIFSRIDIVQPVNLLAYHGVEQQCSL